LRALPSLKAEDLRNGALLPGEDPTRLTPYGAKGFTSGIATAPTTTVKAN
jgi:hypothetical protein